MYFHSNWAYRLHSYRLFPSRTSLDSFFIRWLNRKNLELLIKITTNHLSRSLSLRNVCLIPSHQRLDSFWFSWSTNQVMGFHLIENKEYFFNSSEPNQKLYHSLIPRWRRNQKYFRRTWQRSKLGGIPSYLKFDYQWSWW